MDSSIHIGKSYNSEILSSSQAMLFVSDCMTNFLQPAIALKSDCKTLEYEKVNNETFIRWPKGF